MNSTYTDLIGKIRDDPDNDAPRLTCADWLEKQGDASSRARAKFIRLQIERAQLVPNDSRQSELESRELRLLRRHAAEWCGRHFVFEKCRFRRGFIEYVHLHLRHFQHHRRQMMALEPVRDVSLTGWHRADADLIRRVAACEEWRYIETLRIHPQGAHQKPRDNLVLLLEMADFSRLRRFYCPMMECRLDVRHRLERMKLLQRLGTVQLNCYASLYSKFPPLYLRKENLDENEPAFKSVEALDEVLTSWSSPTPIHIVNLPAGQNLTPDNIRRMCNTPALESLVELNAQYSFIGREGVRAIAQSDCWKNLRVLNVRGTGIWRDDLREVINSKYRRNLTWLMADCMHGDEPQLDLPPEMADEIAKHPNLSCVSLNVRRADPRSLATLFIGDYQGWAEVDCCGDGDATYFKGGRYQIWPPTDDGWERRRDAEDFR